MRREDFLSLLTKASGGVRAAYKKSVDEWEPEEPPVTTLFAVIGDRIAEDFALAGVDANRRIFLLIENAMARGDLELVTAVATGLVEALVSRAVQTDGLWEQMVPLLGAKTEFHAKAWLGQI